MSIRVPALFQQYRYRCTKPLQLAVLFPRAYTILYIHEGKAE